MTRRGRARRSGARAPRASKLRSKLLALASLAVLLTGAAVAALWVWARRGGASGEIVRFESTRAWSASQLASELAALGLVDEPLLFEIYAVMTRAPARIASGTHLLRRGLSPAALLSRLTRSAARPIVKLTIPEGYNRFQIAERLEAREVTWQDAFLAASVDRKVLDGLGLGADSAEGYLFPATYELYVDSDAAVVLRTLAQEGSRRFRTITERHAARVRALKTEFGWDVHELVTLASIVEKEAANPSEHGPIASVFYNRLRDPAFRPRRMLQSDPTAGYGCVVSRQDIASCRDYHGTVTPLMLRDPSNPYNTYKRPGLPPGPIASPGESAFEAVIDPPETPFFFFVAGRSKRHVFSRTLTEHEQAITTEMHAPEPSPGIDASAGGVSSNEPSTAR